MFDRSVLRAVYLPVVLLLLLVGTAEASHFRFATFNWKRPDPVSAPLTVLFTVQFAWRADFVDCSTLDFGDGTTNDCTTGVSIGSGVDTRGNPYELREYQVAHTYAGPGTYVPSFEGCCRAGGLQNGSSENWRVEAVVDLGTAIRGGPVTASPPAVQLTVGAIRTFSLPVVDPDGDPISCRFATSPESGLPVGEEVPMEPSQRTQPNVVALPAGSCTVTWDVTLAAPGQQYVLAMMVESTHSGSIVKTPLDLLVEMVSTPPPSCAGSGVITVPLGDSLSTEIVGTGGTSLTMTTLGLPAGATTVPAAPATQSSPFPVTLEWTPQPGQEGPHIVVVNYIDTNNIGGRCSLTIDVRRPPFIFASGFETGEISRRK